MVGTSEPGRDRDEDLGAVGGGAVVIWAADTAAPGFAEECRRQSRLIRQAEAGQAEAEAWWEASDTTGWTA